MKCKGIFRLRYYEEQLDPILIERGLSSLFGYFSVPICGLKKGAAVIGCDEGEQVPLVLQPLAPLVVVAMEYAEHPAHETDRPAARFLANASLRHLRGNADCSA
jgi:hypothetical protein